MPTRPLALGFGLGVPELAFVEFQSTAFGRCQVGTTFTFAPAIPLSDPIRLPGQSVSLATTDVFELTPKIKNTPLFYAINPFIRVFPTKENNFYVQLMLPIFKMNVKIEGDFVPRDNPALPLVPVTGSVTLTQLLPTFSVGYFFSSKIYYFNLAIGIAGMLTPTTSTSISAAIPDSLGGNSSNGLQLDGVNSDIQTAVGNASTELRKTYGVFPSLHLSFGFYL